MERSWIGKNVDLAALATMIENFFKEKKFQTSKIEISGRYQIFADNSPRFKIRGYACVTIERSNQNLHVKIERCGVTDLSYFSSFFLRMIGGGYLVLQEIKSKEAWKELEKEFWRRVEKFVLHLSNSA